MKKGKGDRHPFRDRKFLASVLHDMSAVVGADDGGMLTSLAEDWQLDLLVRSWAIDQIASKNVQSAIPALAKLASTREPILQASALQALGDLNAVNYVQDIAEALADDDPSVRQSAAEALGKMKAAESVRALTDQYVKEEHFMVRSAIITSLTRVQTPEAQRGLRSLQKHTADRDLLRLFPKTEYNPEVAEDPENEPPEEDPEDKSADSKPDSAD